MIYRQLGNTGISASVIGLGSEGLVGMKEENAVKLIGTAIDEGVNYFDLYNPQPEARMNLGKGITGHRQEVYIQGHLCTAWENGQYLRTRDLDKTRKSFETMCQLVGTDYIDVGMIHYVDKQEDFDTIFNGPLIEYVRQLKKEGRIHHIGISSHNPVIAKKCVETGDIEVVLFAVNPAYDMTPPSEDLNDLWDDKSYEKAMLNIDPDRDAFHKLCATKHIGVSVMKAFAGGDLLNAKLSPFGVALTPTQCIHYALSQPGVTTVLGGFRNVEELMQSVHYCEATDSERDFAPVLSNIPKHSFRGKCMYCGHCAPCSVGIDVATVNKFYDLCVSENEIPETVRDHYKLLDHHAGECIRCGRCERNCPFEVKIIDEMKNAEKLFGY